MTSRSLRGSAALLLLLTGLACRPAAGPAHAVDAAGDYYAGTSGLSGRALERRLHTIVSTGATRLSYDDVTTALQDTDQDPRDAGHVIELYTGRSIAKSDHGDEPDQWNREHVWAKSHGGFGTSPGPGTDLHHLRPSDVSVNAARGNLDFDEGGRQSAEAPGNYSDADSWEPRDAVKGDVARMVLYMSVRWDGGDGYPDLEVDDRTGNGSTPALGRLSTLLRWNQEDPPDSFEERRNEEIDQRWQHNRNPFVDHPEFARAIWG